MEIYDLKDLPSTSTSYLRGHSFSKYAIFSEKLTLLTP